jgi:colanic acid/amylovoran biosynthesis glycosyltransferase
VPPGDNPTPSPKMGTDRSADIAYITTGYPSPSHTFIQREIHELERQGIAIFPISINKVGSNELLSDTDRSDAKRTFTIKQISPLGAVVAATRFTLSSPKAVAEVVRLIVNLGVNDLKGFIWHLFQLVEAMLVVRECERRGVTHIHAHFGEVPATVAWFAAQLGRRRSATSVQTWSVTVHGWREFTNENAAMLRQKMQSATFVAAISDFTRAQLMRIAGVAHSTEQFSVVRCGLPIGDYPFEPRSTLSDVPTVLMTARLADEKGHLVLLEALASLKQAGTPIRAVFIGSGPTADVLASATTRLGLTDDVVWMGAQPPAVVHEQLQACDVFCLPSFAEGLPVVLMEAMAVGRPVITTYISGIPELVENNVTGLVLPAGRSDLLADALQRLVNDDELRTQVVKAGRTRVEAMHNIDPIATQLVDLFTSNVPTLGR